jgi:glycosyltransferase involved in cell wall biosynthesis
MKIAFVWLFDRNHESIQMRSDCRKANCLEKQSAQIIHVEGLKERYGRYYYIKGKVYHILKRKYEHRREPVILQGYAEQIQEKMATLDADIVFSHSSIPISYLQCRQPVVFWTDATFAGMMDFYPDFTGLPPEGIRRGNQQEQAALTNCALAIYASEWAARSAKEKYQVDPHKIRVVSFGANLEGQQTGEDIDRFLQEKPARECSLLLFGVDWRLKGGDVALEVATQLNQQGLKTTLHVIGCTPRVERPLPEFVKVHGFLDKSSQEGLNKIKQVLSETHFLIHPARAEAFGCVLCEANSFGVPCLAANVGGISTAIRDHINGKLFAPGDSIESYCDVIMNSFADYEGYKDLARSSFQEYQTRLNWDVAGQEVKKMLMELI